MKGTRFITLVAIVLFHATLDAAAAQERKNEIVHDAEFYILEAQHGEQWAKQDSELQAKLDALKKKYGTPPNIIHIMWDDTGVGEVGIPAIQKTRGWETPKINQLPRA